MADSQEGMETQEFLEESANEDAENGYENDEEEDDEEEEGEEEDSGDDDDDDDEREAARSSRKPKRRKKAPQNPFLDLEAQGAGDDELDEDEGEAEEGLEDLVQEIDYGQARQNRARADRLLATLDEENLDEFEIEQRYSHLANQYGDGKEVAPDSIPDEGFLPKITDPKLWMVRCKHGKEREVVLKLMRRFFARQEMGEVPLIISAIAPEHAQGYVFIEARKEAHVRSAIHNVNHLYGSKTSLMPMKEMTDVLRVAAAHTALKRGDWVRVKRGTYGGDLAQVRRVLPSGNRVELRVLPRLDYKAVMLPRREEEERKSERPKAQAFNAAAFESEFGEHVPLRDGVYVIKGRTKQYVFDKNGYMFLVLSIASVDTRNVKPTLEELQQYHYSTGRDADGLIEDEKLMQLASLSNIRPNEKAFLKGDKVKVVEGGERGLVGTVEMVDATKVRVRLRLQGDELDVVEEFKASQLAKHFGEGDHVKVIAGSHKGETGTISSVMDNLVWIVSDSSYVTFQALRHDIQATTEVARGVLKLGEFSLHDLVKMGNHNVGVIVKIESDRFKVLDQNGLVSLKTRQELVGRVNARDPVAFDKNNNHVKRDDLLQIEDGALRNRQGKVIHLYRTFAWLLCREVIENGGVVMVKTTHCSLIGGSNKNRFAVPTGHPAVHLPKGNDDRNGVTTRTFGRAGHNDEMLGQEVVIKRGKYKSYIGVVKEALDNKLRVELQANCRVVTVRRDQVRVTGHDQQESYAPTAFSGYNDSSAMRTPHRLATPSRTPLHEADTSAWNPNVTATPARDASAADWGASGGWGAESTGGWSSTAAETPAPPQYQAGGSTPSSYGPTPAATTGVIPTPAYGHSPSTPGNVSTPYSSTPYSSTPYSGTPYSGTPSLDSAGMASPAFSPLPGYSPAQSPTAVGTPAAGAEAMHMPGDWHLRGAVVKLQNGVEAVITEVHDTTCSVRNLANAQVTQEDKDALQPVRPANTQDKVIVLGGERRGQTGSVMALNDANGQIECIIILENVGLNVMHVAILAKYAVV